MAITTLCPGCRSLFRLPEELAGRQARCQKCGQRFLVPGVAYAEAYPDDASAEVTEQIPAPSAPASAATEALAPVVAESPATLDMSAPAAAGASKPSSGITDDIPMVLLV